MRRPAERPSAREGTLPTRPFAPPPPVRPVRHLLPLALSLLLCAAPSAAGETAPPAAAGAPPPSPAGGPTVPSPPAAAALLTDGGTLSAEALRARVTGRHKREVRELFAPPDRMTDLHRNGGQVYGDGAEVQNLFASGLWVYRGGKAARVVDPATGRKGAEIRIWFDLNDHADLVEVDWAE